MPAELKTKATKASVRDFIAAVLPEQRRKDARAVMKVFKRATGESPKLWGPSIVGYGSVLLKYPSGRELDWMLTGFSPRKPALVLYGLQSAAGAAALLKRLGKHKTGKGCVYVADLDAIDLDVLEELIRTAAAATRKKHAGK